MLPNGIDPPPEDGAADVPSASSECPRACALIGAVGRLFPEKGYDEPDPRRGGAARALAAG